MSSNHNPDKNHPFHWCEFERRDEATNGDSVFISSTCYDLLDLRNELFTTMTDWGLRPILSDIGASYFENHSVDSISSCLLNVDRSDVFILILSQRYSSALQQFSVEQNYGNVSATHVEICRALTIHKKYKIEKTGNPLTITVCVRDELKKGYETWRKDVDECGDSILENCCAPPCEMWCPFSALLSCCDFYLNNKDLTTCCHDTQEECKSKELEKLSRQGVSIDKYCAFIRKSCETVKGLKHPWLSLYEDSAASDLIISEKALNRYRLQALAQFFLLHTLERLQKENDIEWQPFKIIDFSTVHDLKDEITSCLRPNIQRAGFHRALVEGRIPVLSIDIPSVLPGAPASLYLILKNVSEFPVIWINHGSSVVVKKISKIDYQDNPNYKTDWQSIGEDADKLCSFESASSTLCPGESLMLRIKWVDYQEALNALSNCNYFLQINYRTTNDLYVADIFKMEWPKSESRPSAQFVKKIPYHGDNDDKKTDQTRVEK